MSKLYEDLLNIIDFQPDREEEAKTEKYLKILNRIWNLQITLPVMSLVLALFLYWFGGYIGCFLDAILLVVCISIYKRYRKRYKARLTNLIKECNFNKLLTAYMVMVRYARSRKDTQELLSAIGNTLFYLGEFEEAKKVMDLVEKYGDTPDGNAYRVSLYAAIARCQMDKDGVVYYTKELEKLLSQVKLPYITKAYENILRYPLLMEIEEKGDYAKALELLKEEEDEQLLNTLNRNYRLYKIAKAAGMEEEASKHRAFVLENGGDTFYKKELACQ